MRLRAIYEFNPLGNKLTYTVECEDGVTVTEITPRGRVIQTRPIDELEISLWESVMGLRD